MTRFTWRVPAALAASAVAGVAIAAAAGSAAPARPGDAQAGAQALAAEPAPQGSGEELSGPDARRFTVQRGPAVPLPSGGNFNGIQWGVDDGTWAQTGAEGMLEYNSACQWLRAWRDGRDADLALKVLSTAAGWPALRGSDSGQLLTRVAAEARSGGGRTTTLMLADCDQSHAREVVTAARLGLTPSS